MNASVGNTVAKEFDPTTTDQRQELPAAAERAIFDKERLAVIQQELAAKEQRWPDRIAATVEEDYQQLLKDFGLC